MKLKWKVAEAPSGPYRSFYKRGWPDAQYENGDPAVYLVCEDEYIPAKVKTGEHRPITICMALWRRKEEGEGPAFSWMRLKKKANTLKEAKEMALDFLTRHPEWHVK